MAKALMSPRMEQIIALLGREGEMSQMQMAAALGISHSAVCHLMYIAVRDKLAYITTPWESAGYLKGRVSNLYAKCLIQPAPRYRPSTMERRQAEALFQLGQHPEGLTQKQMNVLTQWGHSGVTATMYALEQAERVIVTGGTHRQAKMYSLPGASSAAPTAPITPRTWGPAPVVKEKPSGISWELRDALRLIKGMRSPNARTLAIAGNYRIEQAEKLLEQLKAGGHIASLGMKETA